MLDDVTANGPKHKCIADDLAARFQTIEPRWEKKKRRPKHFTLAWRRRRELQIILQHRYPDGVPVHIDIDKLVWVDAQTLGDSLGLTTEERSMMKITTVRPCDQTPEQMAALRKAKKRERDRKRQRQKHQPRAEYLAKHSTARRKPWVQYGISRRTWYRRFGTSLFGTSLSPATSLSMRGDTPVPLTTALPGADRHDHAGVPDSAFPFAGSVGYLLRLWEYRKLTRGGKGRAGASGSL